MRASTAIVSAAIGLMAISASAQSIKYPSEIADIYNKADKEAVLTTKPRPIIGIPTTETTQIDVSNVQQHGGIAIIIPQTTDASALRDIAAQLDGLVLSKGVSADNEYSVLLNKVASDRNIPIMAETNKLMAKIDSGLWRIHDYCKDTKTLISRAQLYKRAKALHSTMFSVDTHADLPENYVKGWSIGLRKTNQVSIQKMQEGGLDGEFLVDFLSDGAKTPEELDKAEAKAKKLLDDIYVDMEPYKDFCGIATTPEEALQLKAQGKKALFIALENGAGIGKDLKNVKYYADKGVTYITLTWMKDNALCSSSSKRHKTNDPSKGLTPYGKKVVKEMNKWGIMVDCSHCSEQTFWDCIKLSKAPIICSHSGCMANFTHDRNITDDQIRALAKKGGVLQIYAVWNFQGPGKYITNIHNMVNDIDHAVKVGGIDHVGIGGDFDGGGGYTGMMAENDIINITMELMKKGYSNEDIAKIWGGNILRVLGEAKRIAKK